MRGLSSLERVVLECIGNQNLSYEEILFQSGLQENVCFNIIQALIIRGVLKTSKGNYIINDSISPLMMEEMNGVEARKAESLELIEAVLEREHDRIFRFQKVAMDERDAKIFKAMLSNLESFLKDAHQKAEKNVPLKNRQIVFWGMGALLPMMNQVMRGN